MSDEEDPLAVAAMARVTEHGGVLPRIWWYELRNALLLNERRKRISPQQVSDTVADSRALGISVDDRHDEDQLIEFSRRSQLGAHEAAYLEVASRLRLPLATLDPRLREAAETLGIAILH